MKSTDLEVDDVLLCLQTAHDKTEYHPGDLLHVIHKGSETEGTWSQAINLTNGKRFSIVDYELNEEYVVPHGKICDVEFVEHMEERLASGFSEIKNRRPSDFHSK